ncbi:MAG: DUF305 domain-containing protein [Bdellovibrionales bacterium]
MQLLKTKIRSGMMLGGMLLLSACNVTAGTPYPTSYTGGPPPIEYGMTYGTHQTAVTAKTKTEAKTSSMHDGHTDHVHDWDEAMAASSDSGSVYDDVMNDMHKAMAAVKPTGDPDIDFAAGMVPHHQGAIDMAEVLLAKGDDPKLRRLAREIIVAQRREIQFMNYWLATRGKTEGSNITNVNVVRDGPSHQH